jgi:hypothetical protein
VQGDRALLALRAFQMGVQEYQRRQAALAGVSFSAGVIVAAHRTPIPQLHKYALELCRSAKTFGRRIQKTDKLPTAPWTCDIAILTGSSPLATGVRSVRQNLLTIERGRERLRLTSGPWTFDRLMRLAEALNLLGTCGVASSALHNLVEALATMDRVESTAFARAQWARNKLLRAWVGLTQDMSEWPWRECRTGEANFETDLADLARWRGRLDADLNVLRSAGGQG